MLGSPFCRTGSPVVFESGRVMEPVGSPKLMVTIFESYVKFKGTPSACWIDAVLRYHETATSQSHVYGVSILATSKASRCDFELVI